MAQEAPKFQAPKKKRKWPIRLAVVAVIVVVLIFAFCSCAKKAVSTVSGAYIPAQAARRSLAVTVAGTGTVQPADTYRAAPMLRGEILDAPFEEGDLVRKGQVLFRLDPTDGENAVRSAESSLKRAQLALDQSQLSYDNLLKSQRDAAENVELKANAAGTVSKLYVKVGDTVTPGSPVADILDRDTMELTLPFHTVDAEKLSLGQTVTVTVTGSDRLLSGTVSEIGAVDSVLAGGARVRSVTVRVPNPGALTAGTTAAAQAGEVACAQSGAFTYAASKQLYAPVSGKVETLLVKEGDKVSDGQLLGALEAPDMSQQLDSAALSLRSAQLSLEDAQTALDRARDALDDYVITAPFTGTVVEKSFTAGDKLENAGTTLAVLYDLSRLTFDMNISELDITALAVGQSVTFTSDALEGKTFTGTVSRVGLNGVTAGGSTSYPVTVDVTSGDGLYPGMNVSATVLIQEVGEALTVPVDAIQRGDLVYVAGPGALNDKGDLVDVTKLVQRPVTLGRNDSENIEILSGLAEGETVFLPSSASNIFAQMMGMGGGR